MGKLLRDSNSKFVVNLFKSFGVVLSLVTVSSCGGDKDNEKNKVGGGEHGNFDVDKVLENVESFKKFAAENGVNIEAGEIENVYKNFVYKKNSLKNKGKAGFLEALKKVKNTEKVKSTSVPANDLISEKKEGVDEKFVAAVRAVRKQKMMLLLVNLKSWGSWLMGLN